MKSFSVGETTGYQELLCQKSGSEKMFNLRNQRRCGDRYFYNFTAKGGHHEFRGIQTSDTIENRKTMGKTMENVPLNFP